MANISIQIETEYYLLTIIEPSARKHGVTDEDMLHAFRNHWRQIEADDVARTVLIGPSTTGKPLETVIVRDEAGTAIFHAMVARRKFLEAADSRRRS